jgi:8-oxo-dGTP diphosphatase
MVLLQRKSRGRFGEGKWNAPGGKLENGEDPLGGVVREVYEETGLHVSSLYYHGVLKHYFGKKDMPDWVVHIFSTSSFEGQLQGNEEGELKWFSFESIPFEEMWEDDIHWLPHVLNGRRVEGEFFFSEIVKR